ncbi:MAG TPA: CHASE2 domain-containing protein [Coleofasciculaceae cyanobacterium]
MMDRTVFKLKVKQVGTDCNFELSWGKGQSISVDLNYPVSLTTRYEQWQRAYLDYYRRLRSGRSIASSYPHRWQRAFLNYYRRLRGRKVISGTGTFPVDRHKELVNAEAQLLDEFQRWLLSPELVSIRREIAKAAKPEPHWVEVFLTCTPLELARLPWETWEIGTDLGTPQRIRIVRTPANIVNEPVHPIRRKARILAILGDDTGLNFEQDKQAVRSLSRIAEVKFIGWKGEREKAEPNTDKSVEAHSVDANTLKSEIVRAIADERGWDVLFFAGHSNETALTGGELGIAPKVSLSIREIEEAIKQAKQQGLQFAIFNSCSGIDIAQSLINLGLSQVVVMREPIHNQVAQEFLVQFLKSLAEDKDVHEALLEASQFLKQQEKRLSYPAAYLVPSLFRHPEAELFYIKRFGLLDTFKRWLPTPKEAKWMVALLFISLVPPVQNLLLEPRILGQAAYRQATFQVPAQVEAPVLLVQIDNKSLLADKIQQRYPIDYSYLARLVHNLSKSEAKLIGIDYVLDQVKQQPQNSQKLKQSIRDAIDKKTWFVFGYQNYEDPSKGRVSNEIANLNWSMEGNIAFFQWYVELPAEHTNCSETCPFTYLLALSYSQLNQKLVPPDLPQPDLHSQHNFRSSVINPKNRQDEQTAFLQKLRLHPITSFLQWFHPIIDFSIPHDRAYKSISACELLGSCERKGNIPDNLHQQVVIITPGGYEEAGLEGQGGDNYTMPLAVAFWRGWGNGKLPGGEAHAYMLHHLLTRRLVVPIPDFWMILIAALVGKGMTLILLDNPTQQQRWLMGLGGATAVYVLLVMQIYISAAVLFPWFLPSVVFWNYVRLALRRKSYG